MAMDSFADSLLLPKVSRVRVKAKLFLGKTEEFLPATYVTTLAPCFKFTMERVAQRDCWAGQFLRIFTLPSQIAFTAHLVTVPPKRTRRKLRF